MPAQATYEPLATTTLSSSSSFVEFSSISQNYTDLIVVGQYSFVSNGVRYASLRVGNGSIDTASNYSDIYLDTYYGTINSGRNSNAAQALFSYSSNSGLTTSQYQGTVAHLMNYSNTTTYKSILNKNMSAADMISLYGNVWRSTSAINIVRIIAGFADFASGSIFTLYGIKAA